MDKLQRLEKLLEAANQDYATPDEVAEVVNVILMVIKEMKDQLEKTVAKSQGEVDSLYSEVYIKVKSVETRVSETKAQLKEDFKIELGLVQKQLSQEVGSLRDLIPKMPDLSKLENRIDMMENKIPTLPPELTPQDIRNKLEILGGEERLDVRAVNNAPKMTVSLSAPKNPEIGDLWAIPER